MPTFSPSPDRSSPSSAPLVPLCFSMYSLSDSVSYLSAHSRFFLTSMATSSQSVVSRSLSTTLATSPLPSVVTRFIYSYPSIHLLLPVFVVCCCCGVLMCFCPFLWFVVCFWRPMYVFVASCL